MDKTITLTQEELQLIYTACINYTNKLEEIIKEKPKNEEVIRDEISNKVRKHWRLANKVIEFIEV